MLVRVLGKYIDYCVHVIFTIETINMLLKLIFACYISCFQLKSIANASLLHCFPSQSVLYSVLFSFDKIRNILLLLHFSFRVKQKHDNHTTQAQQKRQKRQAQQWNGNSIQCVISWIEIMKILSIEMNPHNHTIIILDATNAIPCA